MFHKISWEPYIKKFIATQCRRCQIFGHAAANCNQKFRCVKCISFHGPGECKKLIEDTPICVNCNEEHSANYKKCKVFIQYTEKNEKMKKIQHKKSDYLKSSFINSNLSYRSALISDTNFSENIEASSKENEENPNNFLFIMNEIKLLFNTSVEELMKKIKAFMPTYSNSSDQFNKKCLLISFLSEFV